MLLSAPTVWASKLTHPQPRRLCNTKSRSNKNQLPHGVWHRGLPFCTSREMAALLCSSRMFVIHAKWFVSCLSDFPSALLRQVVTAVYQLSLIMSYLERGMDWSTLPPHVQI